jgi:hypothetical protein
MVNIKSAISGGIVATVVTGSMILMNHAIHRLPDVGIGPALATMVGLSDHVVVGWLAFIVLAVAGCSIAFAFVAPKIPLQSYLMKGLACGVGCWLLMMLVFMPLSGAGIFGMNRGHILAAVAIVLNLVYWVVLSLVYRWSIGGEAVPNRVRA